MGAVQIIYGGAGLRPERGADPQTVNDIVDVVLEHGIEIYDTARVYGGNETLLGEAGTPKRMTIDTKVMGGFHPRGLAADKVKEDFETSLTELKVEKVHRLYIHAPDPKANMADYLSVINDFHRAGKFEVFGLSNYRAADVETVYNHCKEKGYVLPTAYQGNYNPLARGIETALLPTLRRLGIALYAYSPIAGGFLARSKEQILGGEGTRFREGQLYHEMYSSRGALVDALVRWSEIAAECEGCEGGPAELAYRWVRFNSALDAEKGDAILVGAKTVTQARQSLAWLSKGPLDESTARKIEKFWEMVREHAPEDNYHSGTWD